MRELVSEIVTEAWGGSPGVADSALGLFGRSTIVSVCGNSVGVDNLFDCRFVEMIYSKLKDADDVYFRQ